MNVYEQIRNGIIVSPTSKQKLFIEGNFLYTQDRTEKYDYINGVPCFIDYSDVAKHKREESAMLNEYNSQKTYASRIKQFFTNDYRNKQCNTSSAKIFLDNNQEKVFLSIGGVQHDLIKP